ncbi:MAG: TolA-binding protein [Myxococcota bacterium]|jgi:TolA-binding protein
MRCMESGIYRKLFQTLLVLALTSPLLVGCVTLGKYRALEQRVVAMEKFRTEVKQTQARDTARVENLNTRLKESTEGQRKITAGLASRVDALSDDGRRLLGRVDELQHAAQLINDDVQAIKNFLDRKLSFTMVKIPADTPKAPDALYTYAGKKLKAGKLPLARVLFQRYLEQFPKHEKADGARLSIGETYRLQRRYRDALKAYFHVYQPWEGREAKAPPEAATALWLAGQALLESGECGKAMQMYKLLASSFKKAPEALKAKEKVKTLSCK